MSRSAEPGASRDGGFTLLEVMVSLGVIVAVMTAVLPQLVVGIRSGEVSRTVTQAKGLAQGQLDRMRNMPYHVAPEAGDYRDVLDYYFRNLTAPGAVTCTDSDGFATPATAWSGYVSGTAKRCSYEPTTGVFYRYVVPHPTSGADPMAGFQVVVDTQFLSSPAATGSSSALTPVAGYNSQVAGKDAPASSQIGVTVTVVYDRRGVTKPVSTYTQIADQPTSTSRLKVTASATAVDVGSITTANGALSLQGGLLNLTGTLSFASNAGASLAGTSAGLATGEQAAGASSSVGAPATTAVQTASASGLLGGCQLACWGGSRLDLGPVSATGGLPNVGSAASPMRAMLTDTTNNGLSFQNATTDQYRSELGIAGPLVRLDPQPTTTDTGVTAACDTSSSGTPAYLRSTGFIRTTALSDPVPTAEACAVSSTGRISLFPTTFAPRGVLQVELVKASARCIVTGAAHVAQTPTYDYKVVVRRHLPGSGGSADADSYEQVAVITPASTTDTLAATDLSTLGVGGGHTVGDYVASWSALVPDGIDVTASTGISSVQVPGVLKLTSRPMRKLDGVPAGDPSSAMSFTLGEVGCSSQDAR